MLDDVKLLLKPAERLVLQATAHEDSSSSDTTEEPPDTSNLNDSKEESQSTEKVRGPVRKMGG